jgi:hypothetical protein
MRDLMMRCSLVVEVSIYSLESGQEEDIALYRFILRRGF